MSIKSFDDFCAKMVNNEPLSQKEILDERQKITRRQTTARAAILFSILCVVNTFIMDSGLKWCETFTAPMLWFYIASYVYWLIANAVKGSLFGVEGTLYAKRNGILFVFISVFDALLLILDEKEFVVLKNGMLSNKFMAAVLLALSLLSGIITLLLVHRYNKKQNEE
ncbi:MAG: hypothetical protein ACI4QY_05435 [Oscillospiraceae bacterium]